MVSMRIKAIYENKVLKPLQKLDLREGEEVEIELKEKRKFSKKDLMAYAGIFNDLTDEEEKMFMEAVKRGPLFGRKLNL
ncbi:MAG: antitoxin family protein [Halobacteriota archaeon]